MLNNFTVFILTHGRSDAIVTTKTLKNCGYTGPVVYIVDNEDDHLERYLDKFGSDNVYVFDKKELADSVDEGNNFDDRRAIIHARNVCFIAAKDLGYKYFLQLDDDYTQFKFRFHNKLGYEASIKNIDTVFDLFIKFLENSGANSIAFSQGGDHIGGFDKTKLKRKCMNSFFCSVDRPFRFIGTMNEDVNTYTTRASRGELFFTFTSVQLDQKQTQSQSGGITDLYLKYGTYCKSFTSVMMMPSSVKVSMMNTSNKRLHHSISWKNTIPSIVSEEYKKRI